MRARDEHDSKKKSERGKENSAGQAECICVRTFFAQQGQSGGDGAINEKTRHTREKSVRAKATYDGKNQEQRSKNHDGNVRRAKARVNPAEESGKIAAFAHGKSDARGVQDIGAKIAVGGEQGPGSNDADSEGRKKLPSRIHRWSGRRSDIGDGVNHEILHGDEQKRGCQDGGKQRDGYIFARLARLAGNNERGLESSVGIQHEENGFKPVLSGGRCGARSYAYGGMQSKGDEAGDHEKNEQTDLGGREEIT